MRRARARNRVSALGPTGSTANTALAWVRIAGREVVSTTGDLLIADADAPFEAEPIHRYADELWLVPKALLDPHLPVPGRLTVTRLSSRSGVQALAASYLGSLTRNWDNIPEAAMGLVADTLVRLIGIACGAAAEAEPQAVARGRLVEAKRFIDRHLPDRELSPTRTAVALGISVRALHQLFEPPATASLATCCTGGCRSAGRRC